MMDHGDMTDVERVRGEQAAASRGRFSRAWFVVLAVVVTASLIGQVVLLIRSGSDVNAAASEQGVGLGVRFGRLVSYFTIESNLLVLAAAVSLILRPGRDGRGWRVLHLDALLGIVITGLVFGIVLAGQVHHTGFAVWVNAGLHYFAPWWALAGWLLFGPRPRIGWSAIAWAFVWPIAWIGYIFLHGAVTGWYPYPFMNAHTHGYAVAVRNTAIVVVLGAVIALALKALDGRLPTIRR
jgi:hypothetical protein